MYGPPYNLPMYGAGTIACYRLVGFERRLAGSRVQYTLNGTRDSWTNRLDRLGAVRHAVRRAERIAKI